MNFIIASLFSFPLLFLMASCSDCKDNSIIGKQNSCKANGTCDRGFECVADTCQCPPGGLIYNRHCLKYDGIHPGWVGFSGNCFCYDTFALTLIGTGSERMVSMPFKSGTDIGSASTNVSYFTQTSGDSLYISRLPVSCDRLNADKIEPEAFGKVLPDGRLRMRLLFRDVRTQTVVNECTMIMQKRKQ